MSNTTNTLSGHIDNQVLRILETKRLAIFLDIAALLTKHYNIANPIEDSADFLYEAISRGILTRLGSADGDQHIDWPIALKASIQEQLETKVLTEFPDSPDIIIHDISYS